MTPKEIYTTCVRLQADMLLNSSEETPTIYAELKKAHPTIYGKVLDGTLDMQQFKALAECAQSVRNQLEEPSTSGPPPPVLF